MDIVEGQGRCKANAGLIARLRWDILDILTNSYFYGGGVRRKRLYLRPLNTAITSNPSHCLPVVQLLLEHGADPSKRDGLGKLALEYAMDLRVNKQMKQRLISLLLAHEQILVLKSTRALSKLSDIAEERYKFLDAASKHSQLTGPLGTDQSFFNPFTLFDIFDTWADHLRPDLAHAIAALMANKSRAFCLIDNADCLLKCAVYTKDMSLIELVVDVIGAVEGVNIDPAEPWPKSQPWPSQFQAPGGYELKEEEESRIHHEHIRSARAFRRVVEARKGYLPIAALLQAGISPFVGSLESLSWIEAREECHLLQNLVPVFGAIETQDPVMLSLLLSYKRVKFPEMWQNLVLDYSIVERLPFCRAAPSQLLLVARYLGPKISIEWAVDRKNEIALKILLDFSTAWLDSCRNVSELHVE